MRPVDPEQNLTRGRRVAWTAVSSVIVRGVSMVTSLIAIPVALGYLGPDRYGVVIAVTSIMGALVFVDLGIGNGLMSLIATASGREDQEAARLYVASSAAAALSVAAIGGAVFIFLYRTVAWGALFNVSDPVIAGAIGPAVAVAIICFLASLPLGLAEKIEFAYQGGYRYNFWLAVASLIALLGLLGAVSARLSLPWIVASIASVPALAGGLSLPGIFVRKYRWLRFGWRDVSLRAMSLVVHKGGLFFLLQLSIALAFYSDNLIIARVLGAEQVADYAVPWKLFNFVSVFIAMVVAPLWPAYGEALARGDLEWVRSTFRKSLSITMVFSLTGAALLVLFGRQLLDLWVGPSIQVSTSVLVGLAAWLVLGSCGTTAAMFLNGVGKTKIQAFLALIMTIGNVGLSILLCRQIGIAGAIWGTVISYLLAVAIPLAFLIPRMLQEINLADATIRDLAPATDQRQIDLGSQLH